MGLGNDRGYGNFIPSSKGQRLIGERVPEVMIKL